MAAITLEGWPGWTSEFELVYQQEFSGQPNGVMTGKDMGTPVWRGGWFTKELIPNALDYWKARIEQLQGIVNPFYAYPLSRMYPSAHPNGDGLPASPKVGTVAGDYASLSLSSAGGLTLHIGDMISIGDRLHRVLQESTNGSSFNVAPYIFPDVTGGMAVRVANPRCIMRLVPGSYSAPALLNGRGTVSFMGMQDLAAT